MEPKLLINLSLGKKQIFRMVGKVLRQMKLFSFMNCRVIDMSSKLEVEQVAWNSIFLIET